MVKNHVNFKILLLAVCLLGALQAAAQVKISGKVVDEDGKPVEFARVSATR